MKKIFLIILFFNFLFSKSIFIIDTSKTNFYELKKTLIPKLKDTEYIIIKYIYNPKYKNNFIISTKYKSIQKGIKFLFPLKKVNEFNVPYLLYLAYQINKIDPSYNKIYLINSIFYKDNKYDFSIGYPSDSFAEYKNFLYLPKFKNNIDCYIFVDKDNFLNESYFNKYRRFYYFWLKSKNITLKNFNSEYSFEKEKFNYTPLNLNEPLEIKNITPKKIMIQDDEVYTNLDGNILYITITNPQRNKGYIEAKINNKSIYIPCKDGICKYKLKLKYGKNTFIFKKLSNKLYKKTFINKCKINSLKDKNIKSDKNTLVFYNPERPVGSYVDAYINDKHQRLKVNKNHQFIIKIPSNLNKINIKIKQQNCSLLEFIYTKKIPPKKIQNENLKKVNEDKQILILKADGNGIKELEDGKNTFNFDLPKPIYIKEILLYEADADNDTISIGIVTENNKIIMLQNNIRASGNCGTNPKEILNHTNKCYPFPGKCCMIHDIKVPSNFKVKSIILNTKSNLYGLWYLKKIEIIKDNK